MNKTIKSISYLRGGVRHHVSSNASTGRFRLLKIRVRKPEHLARDQDYNYYTALTFVFFGPVKANDPFLTLNNGDKIRVFQGGDSTCITATAHSYIEHHDNEFEGPKIGWHNPFDFDFGGW